MAILVIAIGGLTTPTTPLVQTPVPASPQISAQLADRAARDARSAEIKTAALGVAQIRHAVANAGTLSFSRVTVSPTSAICYQFQLRNSRGVSYNRTAIVERGMLRVSGSDSFTALWNRRCVDPGAEDVTSDLVHGKS